MLTILFATRNGARLLPEVLSSYTRLISPAGGWRLVAIDNGSSDDTARVLGTFTERLPLTILDEPRPGKNVALNKGLGAIAGDLVVFTDDDTFPRPDWLVALCQAAAQHPEAALFGGAIVPRWESPPPDWIKRVVPAGPVFTLTTASGHVEGPIDPGLIFGPNMAVRAEIFAKGFRFDETIGPKSGASYAMGSESEFTARVAGAGYGTWFCAAAIVEHFIRTTQLDRRWILKRAVRYGRGQYRLKDRFANPPPPRWFGAPRYFYRQALAESAALLGAMIWGDADSRFRAEWALNLRFGQILEARAFARAAHLT